MVHGEEEAGRLAHVLSDELRDDAGSISLAKAVAGEGCNYVRELATARPYVSVPTRPSGEACCHESGNSVPRHRGPASLVAIQVVFSVLNLLQGPEEYAHSYPFSYRI